ncbi:MAG: methyltransferase domain-containing protein [Phycisphaeraceae bacterium]|nr:methyltransferase domain-containing protein [Phycisphaeraceae bacterium]
MTTARARPGPSFHSENVPSARCPNCDSAGMRAFYSVPQIPVHSVLLMPSRQEAMDFPKRDLKLGFCSVCGFVCNILFDPSVHLYSQRYEETQGFSPTFNAFARQLAQRYVDRYELHSKTTLEIGCGKGEFLALLIELAGPKARGLGIDPGYVPGRLQSAAEKEGRLEYIVDFYGPKYSHLQADFIVCRHTLEHIAPTLRFMRDLRTTIGSRRGVSIFFELPDVMRELREGAFWDLYYEHCTYFSAGSLSRLFRSTGFDVTEVTLEFEGQYIILDAVPTEPGSPPTTPWMALEHDLEELAIRVDRFGAITSKVVDTWQQVIRGSHARGERVVIWGGGSKGVSFLTTLGIGLGQGVDYAVDINPHKHGKFLPGSGQETVPPGFLKDYKPDHVIVMNPIYVKEITQDLDKMGLKPRVWAV